MYVVEAIGKPSTNNGWQQHLASQPPQFPGRATPLFPKIGRIEHPKKAETHTIFQPLIAVVLAHLRSNIYICLELILGNFLERGFWYRATDARMQCPT